MFWSPVVEIFQFRNFRGLKRKLTTSLSHVQTEFQQAYVDASASKLKPDIQIHLRGIEQKKAPKCSKGPFIVS